MKILSLTIAMVSILGLLAYTNPTMDGYENYMHQKVVGDANKKDSLSKSLAILLGGVASKLFANATVRNDYVFFSTYDTDIGGEHRSYLGILGYFVSTGTSQAPKTAETKP